MIEQDYKARRAKLVGEFFRLKKLRLNRSAAARVRMIAKLDFEQCGTPEKKTLADFRYEELGV